MPITSFVFDVLTAIYPMQLLKQARVHNCHIVATIVQQIAICDRPEKQIVCV